MFWNNLKVKIKIPAAIVGFAILVGISIGVASYLSVSGEIDKLAKERLQAIAENRESQLKNYLNSIEQDLKIVAGNPLTAQAIRDFSTAWNTIEGNKTDHLKGIYIKNNPNKLGEKHLLDRGKEDTAYNKIHGKYHIWFRELLDQRGYYDIFLFDNNGNLIYTVFKEEDYATNFAKDGGKWADTDLGNAFRAASQAKKGTISFFDFKPYTPSYGAPASFISTPVIENGKTVGVLVYQMPIDRINSIMSASSGLGKTGETVIVGSDKLMRNNSRFSKENDILKVKIDSHSVDAALKGHEEFSVSADYRNAQLMEVGAPLNFNGTTWAILAVQAVDEVSIPLINSRNIMIITALIVLAVATAGGYIIALTLTRPIEKIVHGMNNLARNNINIAIDETPRTDEIGEMTQALLVFRDNAVERQKLEEERRKSDDRERRAEEEKKRHEQQLLIVEKVKVVAEECARGNFANRVPTDGLDGFLLELAQGINMISDVSERGLTEIRESVTAIAQGDLTQTIDGSYEGMFDEIKHSFNNTLRQLTAIIGDVTDASLSASQGDFSHRLSLEGKKGFIEELAKSINEINDISDRGLTEIRTAVTAIAQGDLSKNISGNYKGMFDEIKVSFNNTLNQLSAIIHDTTELSFAAGKGDFTKSVQTENKQGFMLELANAINSTNDVSLRGLTEIKEIILSVSEGDLTSKVTGEYEGMFDEIKQALNSTIDVLCSISEQVQIASNDVSSASKEIASGTDDLSQRTEEQASALQETSASMEEMSSTVQNNASNAIEASQLAEETKGEASRGGKVVTNAVEAMSRIETSSNKIADITNVIDEIAFQINLLALNAAVEAARAGEAGKGFEVVAAEVRKLAQRSANAAKDIEQLIETSGNEVKQGSELVKETGDSLTKMVTSVTKLADIVNEISHASKEQSGGITQINDAIANMDSTTQQNSALVEQNSAAARSLQDRAIEMQQRIGFFKTRSNVSQARPQQHNRLSA
ncbi:MAG: methyl-accepting chemotaxis protein [Methyloligellaceae bacterium]